MLRTPIQAGDPVVCRVTKWSTSPGPRAINIRPLEHGDALAYQVDKYWVAETDQQGDRVVVAPDQQVAPADGYHGDRAGPGELAAGQDLDAGPAGPWPEPAA